MNMVRSNAQGHGEGVINLLLCSRLSLGCAAGSMSVDVQQYWVSRAGKGNV